MSTATNENKLRHHAEQQFAEELEELKKSDARQRPANWELSPWAVCTYLLGGELDNGFTVSAKYIGNRRIIETAVATLATDRALLLYGVPGTAKSWVSEHLAAAISGDSTRIIQGTAGTSEEQMRYGWNYAELLSKGPSRAALVESPLMRAMSEGRIARVEELTRIPADVQDTLITILSEKTLPIPELNDEVQAVRGFNLIATANNRDKGVNELSSALKRRFNTVILPVPATEEEEISIVSKRVSEMGRALELPAEPPAMHEVRRVVQILPRAAERADRRRQDQAQVAHRHDEHGGGHLRAQQRHGACRALRGRRAARPRRRREPRGRGGQGSRAGRSRLARVPRNSGQGTLRLEGSLSRLPRSGLGKEPGRVLFVESSLPRTPYPQKLRPVGRRRKGSWWCTVGVGNRPMSAPFPFQPCVCRRKTGFPYARFLRVHPSGGKRSKRRPTVVARRRAHARMSIRGKRLSGKPPSFGGHSSPTVYKRLRHA